VGRVHESGDSRDLIGGAVHDDVHIAERVAQALQGVRGEVAVPRDTMADGGIRELQEDGARAAGQ
jgi:hypothetical protein